MQVDHSQVHKELQWTYFLWDGEVIVEVYRHVGAHGFYSAAIVIEHIDGPLEVCSQGFYDTKFSRHNPTFKDLTFDDRDMLRQIEVDSWIAGQLTRLSTGTELNEGGVGNVEGLLE